MIELTPEQEQFVKEQIAEGTYANRSELLQAAVELFKESIDRETAEVVAAVEQGLEDHRNGKSQPLDEAFSDIRKSLGLSSDV